MFEDTNGVVISRIIDDQTIQRPTERRLIDLFCLTISAIFQLYHGDQFYQLLAHGRWFSPGTPASSTTKTGRHDIAEILLKVALSIKKSMLGIGCDFSLYM
jgi:hypothetical protein